MLATIPIKVVLFKSSSLNFINKKNWQIQFNK
jgi:hypothetical protein